MLLIPIFLHALLIIKSNCKILRNEKDFFAVFDLVDANSRIKANCIRNITRNTTPKECSHECVKERRCQSFNRHKFKGFCELLAISKFDESGLLQRDLDWVHFETNDDENNIGSNCIKLKPCKSYQICEDTMTTNPWYKCRCRDGFTGKECQNYRGPGVKSSNRAASCRLLTLKYKSIPDGIYWFKGKERAIKCERKVDGGYTPWALFGLCSESCGNGTQQRNRTCTNPSPKGGGKSCDHLGPKLEVRSCFIQKCPVDGGYSPWSLFGPCSESCVNGTRQRNRTCTNPSPKEGGKSCDHLGPMQEVRSCSIKECPECSTSIFTENPFTTSEGFVFATIGKQLMEYKLQLEFKVDIAKFRATGKTWQNIFELNFSDKSHEYKKRHPGLYLGQYSRFKIHVFIVFADQNLEDKTIDFYMDDSFFNDWIKIKILQQKSRSGYIFQVDLNKEGVTTIYNTNPREILHLKLFLTDPAHSSSANALIRNFHLDGVCDFKQYDVSSNRQPAGPLL